jgi:hypothetical protein
LAVLKECLTPSITSSILDTSLSTVSILFKEAQPTKQNNYTIVMRVKSATFFIMIISFYF